MSVSRQSPGDPGRWAKGSSNRSRRPWEASSSYIGFLYWTRLCAKPRGMKQDTSGGGKDDDSQTKGSCVPVSGDPAGAPSATNLRRPIVHCNGRRDTAGIRLLYRHVRLLLVGSLGGLLDRALRHHDTTDCNKKTHLAALACRLISESWVNPDSTVTPTCYQHRPSPHII